MIIRPFHTLELATGTVLHFPTGILGFPEIKEYRLVNSGLDSPFHWLQALDASVAFVIIDPLVFLPTYHVDIEPQTLQELQVRNGCQLTLVAIVTLPASPTTPPTVNLQGPILMNTENYLAKQLVLVNGPYHTRHPLVAMQTPAS